MPSSSRSVTGSRRDAGDAAALELIGGDLALDFANTAGWHAADPWQESLTDYPALVAWARHVGCLPPTAAGTLLGAARAKPAAADTALRAVIGLRETTYRVFTALARGGAPAPADLAALHAAHVRALAAAQPRLAGGMQVLAWPATPADLTRPVHPVMVAAAALLQAPALTRLRQCDNHPCGWLFVDRSRNGSRRWCSSADCGNASRVRRFRSRRAAAD